MILITIGIGALLLFIVIALSYETEWAKSLDAWAAQTFEGNAFLEAFHVIGNTETISIITLLFALFLIIRKKAWKAALFSVIVVAIGYGLNQELKAVFERARPDIVDQLTSFSFPSGHSMSTTVCLLTLVFVTQQQFFKHSKLYWLYALAFITAVLVALSRVAEARHFFTDITAGVSLGLVIVIAATFFYKRLVR